jgi:hypothetical protein
LKEKIGKFMERKECNAEGKTSACQKPNFISANEKNALTAFSSNKFVYKSKNKPYLI